MTNVLGNMMMAIRGITSNWLRTALTMLGVMIGVASVIVLLAIGTGSSQKIENSIQSLGSNTLTVFDTGGTSTAGTQIRTTQLNTQSVNLPQTRSTRQTCSRCRRSSRPANCHLSGWDVLGHRYRLDPSISLLRTTRCPPASDSHADVKTHAQVIDLGARWRVVCSPWALIPSVNK